MQPIDSYRLGLRIVLVTYSGICTFILFISWLTTFDWVWFLWGSLQGRIASLGLAGQEHCWLCGMSHAFRIIWQGHPEEAVNYNQASLPLFAAMLVGGFGGGLAGSNVRGGWRGPVAGGVAGTIVGSVVGGVVGSMIHVDTYLGAVDIQIKERVEGGVKGMMKTNTTYGSATSFNQKMGAN